MDAVTRNLQIYIFTSTGTLPDILISELSQELVNDLHKSLTGFIESLQYSKNEERQAFNESNAELHFRCPADDFVPL